MLHSLILFLKQSKRSGISKFCRTCRANGIVIIFCLLLPSCTKRLMQSDNRCVEQAPIQNNKTKLDAIMQQEAMLVDIPIPLYDERIIDFSDNEVESDTLIFGYKSPLNYDQAASFFMQQMERYGWRHLVSFDRYLESMLQFESPDRYCTVLIKKSENERSTSIFIYIKRASIEARS